MKVLSYKSWTVEVPKSRTLSLQEAPYLTVLLDGYVVADESDAELAWCAKRALEVYKSVPPGGDVAVLGGGTMMLPRMLLAHDVTVYEREPGLVAEMAERFGKFDVVVGDYRETIKGQYDAIIYHIWPPEDEPIEFLRDHLTPGGVLLGAK